jgi:hypothetical protein
MTIPGREPFSPLEVPAMAYVARIPSSVSELEKSLKKIHDNRKHIKSVRVNERTSHIELDLDWAAHTFGGDAGKDFFLPIRRDKLREALELVNVLMRGDRAPSTTDAQKLYELIDPIHK